MYTFDEKKIKELSEEGFYDFIIDEEENGNITADDKEDIYQYCLLCLQELLDEKAAYKFLTDLNKVLIDKKVCGC